MVTKIGGISKLNARSRNLSASKVGDNHIAVSEDFAVGRKGWVFPKLSRLLVLSRQGHVVLNEMDFSIL